jgi:hypothetical protein
MEIHDEDNPIFKRIKEEIDKGELLPQEPLEDKLITHIINLKQKPIYYLYYIQYEYLRGNLTDEQAFYLTLFFRCRMNDKPLEDVKNAFGDAGINVLEVRINVNKLITIANGLCSILEKDDNFKKMIDNANNDKKVYIGFKEDIWKTIRFDYDVFSSRKLESNPIRKDIALEFPKEFINKWGRFEFVNI